MIPNNGNRNPKKLIAYTAFATRFFLLRFGDRDRCVDRIANLGCGPPLVTSNPRLSRAEAVLPRTPAKAYRQPSCRAERLAKFPLRTSQIVRLHRQKEMTNTDNFAGHAMPA
jgi:hypothetical protein